MNHTTFDRIITIVLTLVCIALAVAIGVHYLGSDDATGGRMPMEATQSSQTPIVNVSVKEVTRGVFTKTSSLGAEITSSRDTIAIASTIAGKVTELFVTEGQEIAEGDALATVDPSTAGSKYKSTTISSPISGTVYEVPAYLGQQVTTNTTLVTLGMTGELEIKAAIAERFLSTLQVGLKASFTTAAWPDEELSATITSISPQVNTTNRTVDITLSIDDPDSRLKEGMFVKLTLITDQQDDVLLIPTDAITTYLGEPVVYIVEGGMAKRIPIVTSDSDDNTSIVVSGLTGGEQLITAGSVVEGTEVSIVKENI
ncbi:MAG: efflux RND transporter periplasmic adaptor subunit [Sphaerochaetaceae bacterium]